MTELIRPKIDDVSFARVKTLVLDKLKYNKLPNETTISTMTVCCKFPVNFNLENIARYVTLSRKRIVEVKYGDLTNKETNRTIIFKPSKLKAAKKRFHNEATLKIFSESKDMKTGIHDKKKRKPVLNVKLFKNGSVQMTGCVSINSIFDVLYTLITEIGKTKAIIDLKTKVIYEKKFVDDLNNFTIEKIKKPKIKTIISVFTLGHKLHLNNLFSLLTKTGNFEISLDKTKHAPLNFKFPQIEMNKTGGEKIVNVNISIFSSGECLITSAKNCEHIYNVWKFIGKFIYKHLDKVVISNENNIENIIKEKYLTKQKSDKKIDEFDFDKDI